ncbi:piggyBac transposable element-derived protein 4-like [Palaemon carinicauda]|uniref:piggyBac transposable element-derived protein 4-like n=1 Tax=Palaemon carinicauda TaxID=392227 RepID=UPI0035B65FB6
MFGFGDNLTLVSYLPKSKSKKKNVVLVSSMHHDDKIYEATGHHKKPEIITFYNSTKGGVDVVDMMVGKYSASRNSRWPLTVFFALLNIVCVNSYVLYAHNPQNKLKRHKFIKKVCMMLLEDTLKRRLQIIRLPRSLRTEIARLFPEAQMQQRQ